jgi:hypothetical protein
MARYALVSPVFSMRFSAAAQRRMNASGLSCWGVLAEDDGEEGETGGSAMEVSPPPQAVRSSSGAVRAPAKR